MAPVVKIILPPIPNCDNKAKGISLILANLLNVDKKKLLLVETYGHSLTCMSNKCTNLCNSLKYIINHTLIPNHDCVFFRISNLLNNELTKHQSECNDSNCVVQLCPETRAAWAILIMTSKKKTIRK